MFFLLMFFVSFAFSAKPAVVSDVSQKQYSEGMIEINNDKFNYVFKSEYTSFSEEKFVEYMSLIFVDFYTYIDRSESSLKSCKKTKNVEFYVLKFNKLNRRNLWPSWLSTLVSDKYNIQGFYDQNNAHVADIIALTHFNDRESDISLLGHEFAHFMYSNYCLNYLDKNTESFASGFEFYLKSKY